MLINYLCDECIVDCPSPNLAMCKGRTVTVICFDNASFKARIEVMPGLKPGEGNRVTIPESWKANRSILAVFDGVCQEYSPWLSDNCATVVYMDQVLQEVGCTTIDDVPLAACGLKPDFSAPQWSRKTVLAVLQGKCQLLNRFGERLKPVESRSGLAISG